MDQQTLLLIFIGVVAIALLIQMVALLILVMVARRLHGQIMELWPELTAIIHLSRKTAEKVEKYVDVAGTHINKIGATSNEILDVTKQQVAKIDELLNDTATRAKIQIERAEMVLDDTMGRAQETVSIVQRTILRPVRELHGVLSGLRATVAHLGRGGRPTVDHATADEEMFI